MLPSIAFRLFSSLAAPCLALACMLPVNAREIAQPETAKPPGEIKVQARKNPGNLPYARFFDGQKRLQALLAPEPRMLDVSYRISFTELSIPEQDAYMPQTWGVSIVGDTVDEPVAVRRGGYIKLPDLPLAYKEKATLMFKEQSRSRRLSVSHIVRVGEDRRLSYADFGKAIDDIRAMQKRIPIYALSIREVKYYKYNGLKACFLAPGATVLVDGKPVDTTLVGNCNPLKFDPALASSSQVIEFQGSLDIVTMVDTEDDLPKDARAARS